MGKGTIGGKIVLEGESQYRAALKNIRTDQAELRSEMKLCQTTFKESQNSLEALTKKHEILEKQIETQTKKVDIYRQAMETSAKKEQDAAKKVEDLQTALKKAEKEMQEMAESSEGTSEAMEGQAKAIEELKGKLKLAEQDLDKASQKTTSYKTAINNAQAELQGMQSELSKTEKYIKEASDSTDKCANSIDEYGKETKEAVEQTSVFGDVLKANLISGAIQTGLRELAEGIKEVAEAAVETGSSFEASMSQVAATMGMTAEEVENGSEAYTLLADAAKKCGKETMFSASQAGEALNYLALAGYDAEKAAATLPKVLDLAAAGGLDLAYASDLVTDSMAAMNMETDKLDNYIDQMAKTSQKSNTSVAQLGEATLVCAGTVSLAGQSLETMNTELGILANNGIKGAEGGTHLRNIILSLSAPTDNAAAAMENLGLEIEDSQGNMRDLNDILIDMNAAMAGMSSVEKTKLISKIFNKTDIASVNALLKGTGEEFDNLYKEINNCSGAAKNMAETLNNNLKGKVTILQSALEGLGISAYELFDDTMKDAVDGATDAVGRLQKSIDNGSMRVSLDRLSKSLGEFCENAIETGEDALPVMIDGLTWILDNGDMIAAGITGIAVANLQMKTVGPAVEAATAAWKAYKTANEGATVSQWLLNTAMNANPAGLLVGAIVGLTAAVSAYIILNKDNLVYTNEVTKATMEQVEAAKALNDAYASSKTSRSQARQNMEAETAVAKKLVEELKQLESKTQLSNTEQTRMKMIVEELNQVLPELNLAIDDQTGKLNMSTAAIMDNVDAMMAMTEIEVMQDQLTEIVEQKLEAEKELLKIGEQLEEQTKVRAEAEAALAEEYAKYEGKSGNAYRSFNKDLITQYESADAALEELKTQQDETTASIASLETEYATLIESIAGNEEVIANAATETQTLGNAAETASGQMTGMSAAVQEAFEAMYEDLSETIQSQMNLFDEFTTKSQLSTEQLLANMQSQIDGVTNWADNLETLADRGINQGLLKYLADMGPEGAAYVQTFVDMTDEELQKANELYNEALALPTETVESIAESYVTAGTQAGEGFTTGLTDSKEGAKEAATEMAEETLTAMNETLDINSPSKEMQTIGEYAAEGLAVGLKEGKQNVVDTVSDLAAELIRTTQNGLQTSKFADIGKQIPAGLKAGIESGRSGVISAVERMCSEAVAKAKAALDINSPSKKFAYLGEMSGEGYIEGWQSSMAGINEIIEASLPDTSMKPKYTGGMSGSAELTDGSSRNEAKQYNINQEINIYSQTDSLIETTRKFRESQKEAATEW